MGPELQITLFALVALVCFIVSLFAREGEWVASVGSTACLVVFWSVNNALWILSLIQSWSIASDALFTMAAFLVFLGTGRRWALALALFYAVDVVLDHLQIVGRMTYQRWAELENSIFVLQLLAASLPGWKTLVTASPLGLLSTLRHRLDEHL